MQEKSNVSTALVAPDNALHSRNWAPPLEFLPRNLQLNRKLERRNRSVAPMQAQLLPDCDCRPVTRPSRKPSQWRLLGLWMSASGRGRV